MVRAATPSSRDGQRALLPTEVIAMRPSHVHLISSRFVLSQSIFSFFQLLPLKFLVLSLISHLDVYFEKHVSNTFTIDCSTAQTECVVDTWLTFARRSVCLLSGLVTISNVLYHNGVVNNDVVSNTLQKLSPNL